MRDHFQGAGTLDAAMEQAVKDGVFPAGVLLWGHGDCLAYHRGFGTATRGAVHKDQVFDLASLTKPLATALAAAVLIQKGRLGLETCLSQVVEESRGTDKAGITVDMLLRHTSGLRAYHPYYLSFKSDNKKKNRTRLRQMILAQPLEREPGGTECYSDPGYILLAWIIEQVSGMRLDGFVQRHVFDPLGRGDLFFEDLETPARQMARTAAPTMDCPWRGRVIQGEVEDENAWAAGGIEGHAGLFGTAMGVYRLCCEILAAARPGKMAGHSRLLNPEVMAAFLSRQPGRVRAAGFDRPSGKASAAGSLCSKNSIGHLGFTGTSFWIDLDSGVITILLTNRVHPSRENWQIKQFRPFVHDLVQRAYQKK